MWAESCAAPGGKMGRILCRPKGIQTKTIQGAPWVVGPWASIVRFLCERGPHAKPSGRRRGKEGVADSAGT